MTFARHGYLVLPFDPQVKMWVSHANTALQDIENYLKRHGGTWSVGVDALPNAPDGSVGGVPLVGAWQTHVTQPDRWHRAQVSVVYPGYPKQDVGESDGAFRYRRDRDAAHVDGLLPEGPDKRRHLQEPHGFVLGLPLGDVMNSPLVVWAGSHHVMGRMFRKVFDGIAPEDMAKVDLTDAYQAARREVFETCPRIELPVRAGEATLLHRYALHGVAPWGSGAQPRSIAYFRPVISPAAWVAAD